jgi:hypothetical protein
MHHSVQADHAGHDVLLIAGHAAGDLSNLDTAAAAALLSTCIECAELHGDLIAIAAATRGLPTQAPAPRDFRITPEQATRLHRGSWLRSLLRPFASARSATRPMAAAFTSAGVVGLLVAAFVPALLGGAASAPTGGAGAFASAPTQAPVAAPAEPQAGQPGAAAASVGSDVVKDAEGSGMEIAIDEGSATDNRDGATRSAANGDDSGARLASSQPPNVLVLGSLGLLALGLVLFGLRFAARRLR